MINELFKNIYNYDLFYVIHKQHIHLSVVNCCNGYNILNT